MALLEWNVANKAEHTERVIGEIKQSLALLALCLGELGETTSECAVRCKNIRMHSKCQSHLRLDCVKVLLLTESLAQSVQEQRQICWHERSHVDVVVGWGDAVQVLKQLVHCSLFNKNFDGYTSNSHLLDSVDCSIIDN